MARWFRYSACVAAVHSAQRPESSIPTHHVSVLWVAYRRRYSAFGVGWLYLWRLLALAVERNSTAAFWWPRVKETLRFLVLCTTWAVRSVYLFLALRKLEVPMFSRRITHTFYFDSEPVAFLVVLAVWGGVGFGLLFYLIRRLRRTYAI